jgi:hypothetical protein
MRRKYSKRLGTDPGSANRADSYTIPTRRLKYFPRLILISVRQQIGGLSPLGGDVAKLRMVALPAGWTPTTPTGKLRARGRFNRGRELRVAR